MPPIIKKEGRQTPPDWAIKQRHLIDLMNRAAVNFVGKYTRPDGTLIWRSEWPGMDGSDDGYESFQTFPLLYLLGGSEEIHHLARRLWNSVTRQFTTYGQVEREFDGYYDWMHHGESSTYLYYLALCDSDRTIDRERALRFAGFYTGEDPDASNWDPELKMIRSPINGSRGPRSEMSAEDWVTHRHILADYLAPYEDVPGLDTGDPFACADWNDDDVFARILHLMNRRMVPGDVPLNLTATSLVTNAYLYTGDPRYREWVTDYLAAWQRRAAENDGIIPDNVGPTGIAGELMDGKWWGGYYGWRWPHGSMNLLESTLVAGANAAMLTGDTSWLDLHRSQGDLLWSLRCEQEGAVVVPHRRGDTGWFDFRPPLSRLPIQLWFMTRNHGDWERIHEWFPDRTAWYRDRPAFGQAGHFWPERWFGYIKGENPSFPDQVLDDTFICMQDRLDRVDADDMSECESWDVHHWQNLNPVVPEGLVQMAMGTPAAVYHGGLLHASVRYSDPAHGRPGLPDGVAALVCAISDSGIGLDLVNTNPLAGRSVVVQAGSFGEHRFTRAVSAGERPVRVDGTSFRVDLGPGARIKLDVGMERFAGDATYSFPEM